MIAYKCPRCHTDLESPDSLAGATDNCPQCGAVCKIPTLRTNAPEKDQPGLRIPNTESGMKQPLGDPAPRGEASSLAMINGGTPAPAKPIAIDTAEIDAPPKAKIQRLTTEKRLEKLEEDLAGLRAELAQRVVTGSVMIMDESGKVRAKLGMGKKGPGLILLDENGNDRAKVALFGERVAMSLLDENGNDRASLAQDGDGVALALLDENEIIRVQSSIDEDGPKLVLLDENEETLVQLAIGDNGIGPGLAIWDETGKTIWRAPSKRR